MSEQRQPDSKQRARWAYTEWQRECERQRQREIAVRLAEAAQEERGK